MKLLLVEGAADLSFVRKLGWTRKESRALGGRGNIANWLAGSNRGGMTALVDEDPGQAVPKYRRDLRDLEKEEDVCVLWDEQRAHRVVVIRPQLEGWIVKTAKESGLAMSRFGFSEHRVELHGQINLRLNKFEEMLDELLRQQSPRLLRLRELLGT